MINYFRWSSLTCVYNTDDKSRIQETLHENKIPFKLSVKDLSIRNTFDFPYGGSGTYKLKLSYSFYVKKKDIDFALHLIK